MGLERKQPDPLEFLNQPQAPTVNPSVKMIETHFDNPSLEETDLTSAIRLLSHIKDSDPKSYKKLIKPRMEDYMSELTDAAYTDLEADTTGIPGYKRYFKQMFILTLFKPFMPKDFMGNITDQISSAERDFSVYLNVFPDQVNSFLADAESQAHHRELATTSAKIQEEESQTLELLTLANAQVSETKEANGSITYTIPFNNDTWKFSIFSDSNTDTLVTVQSQTTPGKITTLPFKKLVELLEYDNFAEVVQTIEENFASEQGNKKLLANFDLPRDREIQYIRVTPPQFDPVITPTLLGSSVFAAKLTRLYPKLEVGLPILTSNPKRALKKQIAKLYKSGTRDFFVDIYSHGTSEELHFPTPLTAADLISISKKFPKANFSFSTAGCYGGGLRKGFLKALGKKRNKKLKERISVFLQTAADTPNLVPHRLTSKSGAPAKMSHGELTFYQLSLLKALGKGETFGAAVIQADEDSKQKAHTNPETIINGTLIAENAPQKDNVDPMMTA